MLFQKIILHLSLIHDIGPSVVQAFVERVGTDQLEKIYGFSISDFIAHGLSQQKAELLVVGLSSKSVLEEELRLMRQHGASIVTFLCDDYPALLLEIHVPPTVLYFQGNKKLFGHQKSIACVGARNAHRYVYDALMHLIVPMMADGWMVVSGGAAGADTYAHQIALDHVSPTIVVVGSGLCHQYPPKNKPLFARVIQQGGLIVSCFAMSIPPEPHCFPIRNRIISGLSRGCLVLQAAAKSGALITAQCALDQGREVFALPGSIFDPLSAGCHHLIQQGAKLVTCVQDIIEELDPNAIQEKNQDKPEQQNLFTKAKSIQGDSNDISAQILQMTVVPITADLLMTKLQIDMKLLQDQLFELSLDGKIDQDAMGFWKRL